MPFAGEIIPCNILRDFGIEFEGTWTTDEKKAILAGAIQVGSALQALGGATSEVEAFLTVLQGMNGGQWRKIRFSKFNDDEPYCTTTKNPTSDYSAYIACDVDVELTEYTVVHEFGHVLVGRTVASGSSIYLGMVEEPHGPGGGALENANGILVMGYRGYVLAIGNRIDWQRSDVITDNGWGSAALWDQTSYYTYDFPEPPPPTPTQFPAKM